MEAVASTRAARFRAIAGHGVEADSCHSMRDSRSVDSRYEVSTGSAVGEKKGKMACHATIDLDSRAHRIISE